MPPSHPRTGPVGFPDQTAWSVVLTARDHDHPEWRSRLDSLIQSYWKPVYWYLVGRWNCSKDDAAELAQEFFMRLFERDSLSEASPERGRFRTFLKLKLRDLVIDDLRRKSSLKRGGLGVAQGIALSPLEDHPEARWRGLSPEEQFDRAWAESVMSSALEELERRHREKGRDAVFRAFWNCTIANPTQTYRDCAQELGIKEGDVKNYVLRTRAELRELVRHRVRGSVEKEEDVPSELEYLLSLFES